jgi:hypothetical protein
MMFGLKIVILLAGLCYLAAMILLPVTKEKKGEIKGKHGLPVENFAE